MPHAGAPLPPVPSAGAPTPPLPNLKENCLDQFKHEGLNTFRFVHRCIGSVDPSATQKAKAN